jgi:hypothetical protein
LASLINVGISFKWIPYGRGSGACSGPYADPAGPAVSISSNNDIVLRSDFSPTWGCLWMTSETPIDLNVVPRIEADVRSSGIGDQWFSLWLDPVRYVQPPSNSAEIDLVENLSPSGGPLVRTNFAGCSDEYRCGERDWGVAGNAVNHHITMNYDRNSKRVEIYHCAFGSQTCAPIPNPPFIQLDKFAIGSFPEYFVVVDIWYTTPGQNFEFAVSNLRFFGDSPSTPSPTPSPTPPSSACQQPNLCCTNCDSNHYCPGNEGCYKEGEPGCPGGYCPPNNHTEDVRGTGHTQLLV